MKLGACEVFKIRYTENVVKVKALDGKWPFATYKMLIKYAF